MKQVVFDTVIDGQPYTFNVNGWDYPSQEWVCFTFRKKIPVNATSLISEEDAILKLVKILEK